MTEYTRVTIQGEGRKADLVLPDDEPIAAVLPEVLSLLDESTDRSSRPVALMTTVGEQLSPSLTLAEQDVEHGTLLRLVRVDEAPPPPEVADVTDIMGDAAEERADAWRPLWGVIAAAALAAVAGYFAGPAALQNGATVAQIGIGAAIALLVAVVAARKQRPAPAIVLTAATVGLAHVGAAYLLQITDLVHPGATLLLWFAIGCLAVTIVTAIGFRDLAVAVGGAIGTLLVAVWVVMHLFSMATLHVAAWVAIIGVVLLGLLPGIAMTASGLTGLDDRVVEGQRVARPRVERAVEATHRSLTWATVATVVPVAVASWILAHAEHTAALVLCAAIGLIQLLRTQVLPLAPQRLALIAGGMLPLLTLGFGSLLSPAQAALVGGGLVVVLAVLVTLDLSANVKARMRRAAGVVELVAVVVLVPMLLWLLGIFNDLISTFVS